MARCASETVTVTDWSTFRFVRKRRIDVIGSPGCGHLAPKLRQGATMIRRLTGSLLLAACLFSVSAAMASDAPRACGAPQMTILDGGRIEYRVVLPRGQAYVELFVRQNGIQNVASEITRRAVDNGDGTATY